MAGTSITIKNDSEVKAFLGTLKKRMGDMTPVMDVIGQIIRTSIVRNFEAQGRPGKWKKHSDTTRKRRGAGARILLAQGFAGGLMGSIHARAQSDRVVVSSNKVYAAVHHFGAKKGAFGKVVADVPRHARKTKSGRIVHVKAHRRSMPVPWGDIPARPYMMVQDEDWNEVKATLKQFIVTGVTS